MNTGFFKWQWAHLFLAAVVAALLVVPLASPAQVFFASGGTTNNANGYNVPNLAFGYQALANTTGNYNTALGYAALNANNSGYNNTAIGWQALFNNTTGYDNTANGAYALYNNTMGYLNTANGFEALFYNTTGYQNTANGYQALYSNDSGYYNTATGTSALYSNSSGSDNAAHGYQALYLNTTGSYNTANGVGTLYSNTTGSNNIALGYHAGSYLTTGSNNIDLGNPGLAGESGVVRIGTQGAQTAAYIAGINGFGIGRGVPVYIDSFGRLGTLTSSRRFKQDIHTMDHASDKLMQLRPVIFRYKQAAGDGSHPLQYGLIAEEVAKVYPDLVQYDKAGKPFTIYYHLLTPMLLNELQKQHRQIVAQKSEIAAQKKEVALLMSENESRKTEVAAMKQSQKSEMTALKAELASLKQAQQQQLQVLAKLAASAQTSQHTQQPHPVAYVPH